MYTCAFLVLHFEMSIWSISESQNFINLFAVEQVLGHTLCDI